MPRQFNPVYNQEEQQSLQVETICLLDSKQESTEEVVTLQIYTIHKSPLIQQNIL